MIPNIDKTLLRMFMTIAIIGFLAPLLYNDGKHDKIYESKHEMLESLEYLMVTVRPDKIAIDTYAMREPFSSEPLISYPSLEASGLDS